MVDVSLDTDAVNKFIQSLSESIQAICHGCIDFNNSIHLMGYVNINIDSGKIVDYVLNEKICKNASNSLTFISDSYHSKKDKPKQTKDLLLAPLLRRRRSKPESPSHGQHSADSSYQEQSVDLSSDFANSELIVNVKAEIDDDDNDLSDFDPSDVISSSSHVLINQEMEVSACRIENIAESQDSRSDCRSRGLISTDSSFPASSVDQSDKLADKQSIPPTQSDGEVDNTGHLKKKAVAIEAARSENLTQEDVQMIHSLPLHHSSQDEGSGDNDQFGAMKMMDDEDDDDEKPIVDGKFDISPESFPCCASNSNSMQERMAEDDNSDVNLEGEHSTWHADCSETKPGDAMNLSGSSDCLDNSLRSGLPWKERKFLKRRELVGCPECGKTVNRHSLTKHIKTHSREKRYKCALCGEEYDRNDYYQKHLALHEDERPHKCPVCDKGFKEQRKMRKHILIHTGEKPYICSLCAKCFSDSSALYKHLRDHRGEKPFECSVCRKTFKEKSKVVRHMRIHTGEKPFKCPVCSRAFNDESSASKHIKAHGKFKTSD